MPSRRSLLHTLIPLLDVVWIGLETRQFAQGESGLMLVDYRKAIQAQPTEDSERTNRCIGVGASAAPRPYHLSEASGS